MPRGGKFSIPSAGAVPWLSARGLLSLRGWTFPRVKPRGGWGHGTAHCARWQGQDTLLAPGNGLPCSGLPLEAAARQTHRARTGSQGFRVVLCVLELPAPPPPLLNFPSLNSAAGRMDCLCCSNKSPLTPVRVTPVTLTQQIRVTSMDSQVPSGLLG